MTVVRLDRLWVLASIRFSTVEIRVEPASYLAQNNLVCLIEKDSIIAEFALYDDGGTVERDDGRDFTDLVSGDAVPGNGVLTRRINSLFAAEEGVYRLYFILGEQPSQPILPHNEDQSTVVEVTVRANSPPIVSNFAAPDSVPSGSKGLVFSASVSDAEGRQDIADVELAIRWHVSGADTLNLFRLSPLSDQIWGWDQSRSAAVGLPTGDYPLFIRARDQYLRQIGGWESSDVRQCWLENLPPHITAVDAPDTVWVPPADTVLFTFTVDADDDQTVADLFKLTMDLSDTNNFIASFEYFDNGLHPDETGGDGRFTAGFSADHTSRKGVPFTFAWMPVDRAGNQGETEYSVLVLIEGDNGAGGSLKQGLSMRQFVIIR